MQNTHPLKLGDSLPTSPRTAAALQTLAQRGDMADDTLVHLIQADPALTGRILRFANAPAQGSHRPVASVIDAQGLLGIYAIRQFALNLPDSGDHGDASCAAFDYAAYWTNALNRAITLQTIATQNPIVAPKEAFTLGLLADVGRLALATAWPEKYGECLRQSSADSLIALERERFSTDHDDLTSMLLSDWGFPQFFLDAMQLSRQPDIPNDTRTGRFALQLALAQRIMHCCAADEAQRAALLPALRVEAAKCGLGPAELMRLIERKETEGHEWEQILSLPAGAQPSSAAAQADLSLNVLLVDDDPIMLARLTKLLEAEGHRVASRRDGESGLQYALEHEPDMVITDWHMKPINGLELCKEIRKSVQGGELYIVMLTATESEDALVEAFGAGIDDYVTKPPNVRVLKARIRAGQRIITLHKRLACERKEIERYSSELASANRRLKLMAHTDQLTNLPNRRYAMDKLEQEWADARLFDRPLSIMMIDLDWFKTINDTLGHDAGDQALIHAAQVMRDAVRTSDIVCRMGGEEFLVITPNTDGAAAAQTAERIRAAIESQQPKGLALSRPLTASIGVADTLSAPSGVSELILKADRALYLVKGNSRNGVLLATA